MVELWNGEKLNIWQAREKIEEYAKPLRIKVGECRDDFVLPPDELKLKMERMEHLIKLAQGENNEKLMASYVGAAALLVEEKQNEPEMTYEEEKQIKQSALKELRKLSKKAVDESAAFYKAYNQYSNVLVQRAQFLTDYKNLAQKEFSLKNIRRISEMAKDFAAKNNQKVEGHRKILG